MKIPPINLVNKTNLIQLAYVIKKARLVIGGDTGPVHLAAGLGVKTLMLMGPTDANRNGPYGQIENAIEVDRDCKGCWKRACPKNEDCLEKISVQTIKEKILAMSNFLI
jgi:heptosyltransferase-1